MRRTHWKHTTIAFITLLTLVGTTPAMAAAPAQTKQSRSEKANLQPRANGKFVKLDGGALAFHEMAKQLTPAETAAAAKPAKGPTLLSRMFGMRTETKAAIADAKAATAEGRLTKAANAIEKLDQPQNLREKFAMWNAARKVNNAAASQLKIRAKAENMDGMGDANNALETLKGADKVGVIGRWKANRAFTGGLGLSFSKTFWRTDGALQITGKAVGKQAARGEYDRALQSLDVVQFFGTKGGAKLAGRELEKAENRYFDGAMKLANRASKDKSSLTALQATTTALEAAEQATGAAAGRFDARKAGAILRTARANHIGAAINVAAKAYKDKQPEYAAEVLAYAKDLVANEGFANPTPIQNFRMNRLVKILGPSVSTKLEAISTARAENEAQQKLAEARERAPYEAAEAKGALYHEMLGGEDVRVVAAAMQERAKATGKPIISKFGGREFTVSAETKVDTLVRALVNGKAHKDAAPKLSAAEKAESASIRDESASVAAVEAPKSFRKGAVLINAIKKEAREAGVKDAGEYAVTNLSHPAEIKQYVNAWVKENATAAYDGVTFAVKGKVVKQGTAKIWSAALAEAVGDSAN